MSLAAIRAALETRLDSISPRLDTAWENTKFEFVSGVPFQRVTLLPAEPENPTFGDDFHREVGLLSVLLFYPVLKGAASAQARAELVKTTFYRGLSLVSNGVTVIIERTPEIVPAATDGDLYAVAVRIRYFANIN